MKMLTAGSAKDISATQVGGHRSSARVSLPPQPVLAAPLVVQRKCACGGECPACQEEKTHALQTKLRVNGPGDPYEQEADQVMEQVMRMPVHPIRPETTCASADRASRGERELLESKPIPVQTIPVIQRVADEEEEETAEPEEEAGEEDTETDEEQTVLTKRISGARPEVAPKLESQINNLKGSGRSLSISERTFFEPRFGYDFSQVRVHTGPEANALATAVNALAFTTGTDIVFGSGQYAPETPGGLKLLAHELTHVAQQQGLSAAVQPYHLARKPKPKTKPKAKAKPKPKPKAKPKPKPKFVCGPNVTSQVKEALSHTKSLFSGWKEKQKEAACSALVTPPEAAFAWDILDLHKNKWILEYRCAHPSSKCPEKPKNPVCATQGAEPPCGSTVQVGTECYYAGSANYVVFGLMCRLCNDHFRKKGKTFFMGMDLGESDMEILINLYKAGGLAGGNVATAIDWAKAGFHLWPAGGTAPAGDKPNCVPVCPTKYQGKPFRIVWCPFSNPYAECTSTEEALWSIGKAILD